MRRREFARTLGLGSLGALCGPAADVARADRHTGSDVQPAVHTVEVESWDGTTLVADLYVPGSGGSHPGVVYTHGSAGNRETVAGRAEATAREGYVVLAPDFRGFNDSGGESTIDGPTEVADFYVLLDALAGGEFSLRDSEETVDVRVRGAPGNPAVGMRGASLGGAIQLLVAAANREWFERLDDLQLSYVETPADAGDDTPLTYVDEAPDPAAVEAAMDHLSLDYSVDVVAPRIPWEDLSEAIAPNDVVKGSWFAFVNLPAFEVPDGLPGLWRQLATAMLTAENEVPEAGERFFERRSPDLEAIAAHGVPTLVVEEWNDGYLPPSHGLGIVDGIREADDPPPVAITLSPLDGRLFDGEPAHNWSYPWEPGVDEGVETYVERATVAWLDRFLKRDSTWRDEFPAVSQYQRQRGEWRDLESFPPTEATPTRLDLAAASATDRTLLANTVAPSSYRGPTGTLFASPQADAPATSAAFEFVAAGFADVATAPRLRLSVTPLGDDAVVFAKFKLVGRGEATGPVVDSQVKPYRFRDAAGERTTATFDLDPFQRYLETGDRLRLVLSTTDNGFYNSREAAGVVVHHGTAGESFATVEAVSERDAPLEGRLPTDG